MASYDVQCRKFLEGLPDQRIPQYMHALLLYIPTAACSFNITNVTHLSSSTITLSLVILTHLFDRGATVLRIIWLPCSKVPVTGLSQEFPYKAARRRCKLAAQIARFMIC